MREPVTQSEKVQNYYGQTLKSSRDLRTDACTDGSLPEYQRRILADIHPEILEKFYGCGSPLPPGIEGCTVLDLGCGTGRDSYLLAKAVGPKGKVIGIDMTPEQLEVANRHLPVQMERWGLRPPNLEFLLGCIEDLTRLGIADASVDVVVSNCVINLSSEKEKVFTEIFRVLKPGGELYFSDVFALRRVPEELREDPVLLGECLAGALYVEDFRRILRECGCLDHRVLSRRAVQLRDPAIEAKIGMVPFQSLLVRAFKLHELEDLCEDYGQMASYLGTLPDHPHAFTLDDHHVFPTGKPMLVCGNTTSTLSATRFARHFRVSGDRSVHFGPFACGQVPPASGPTVSTLGGACC